MKDLSRRDFIKTGLTATAGAAVFTIVPSHVLGKTLGHVAPSDKLNIAGVGIGGVGRRNLKNMAHRMDCLMEITRAEVDATF